MLNRKYSKTGCLGGVNIQQLLYISWNRYEYIISTTHDMKFELYLLNERYGYQYISPLTDYLAIGLIDYIIREVGLSGIINNPTSMKAKGILEKFLKPGNIENITKDIKTKIVRVLKRLRINQSTQFETIRVEDIPKRNLPPKKDLFMLANILQGRFLYLGEIVTLLKENCQGIESSVEDMLQHLYILGKLKKHPSLTINDHEEYICTRCGQMTKIVKTHCPTCGDCYHCEECLQMGESRLCEIIYAMENTNSNRVTTVHCDFDFKLSPAQANASLSLLDFIKQESKKYALIWAVCGAGKTEVSFAAIKNVLEQGGKILFAIPRRDVVVELEPRIRKAFPGERVVALYGGCQSKYKEADIVVATTHQTIRFYRAFDLVILDEADAYPYAGSHMLYHSVERAKKKHGRIIYMTATPNKELFKKRPICIKVPVRYHGRPLPVPAITTKTNKETVPLPAVNFIKNNLRKGKRLFVFVPLVSMTKNVGNYLVSIFGDTVQYSHSGDKFRDEKRINFARGKFNIFVTTTIMERGITVSNASVLVLSADYEQVFDEGTLVQMAGRAGRTGAVDDEVLYSAVHISESMRNAIKSINAMNKVAMKNGLIRSQNEEFTAGNP